MKIAKQFGETVDGYSIPVLNEREIRASAGILFISLFFAWMLVIFEEEYLMIKLVNMVFLADFIIRLFISPKYSPSMILGRMMVGDQEPEYVGAAPKKFAWTIGLVIASIMFILLVVLNTYSVINFLLCQICFIFLFFESVFGICLGCKFYPMFYKEKLHYCSGGICEVKPKQAIQKTSLLQIGVVIGFFTFVIVTGIFLHSRLNIVPSDLWVIVQSFFTA
jgi:hypothetical protein